MALVQGVVLAAGLLGGGDESLIDSLYVRGSFGITGPSAEVNEQADILSGKAEVEFDRGSIWGLSSGVIVNDDFIDVLVEGELTKRSADIDRSIVTVPGLPAQIISGAGSEPVDTWALMGNAWGRGHLTEKLRPYAGGGIGAAYVPSGGLSEDGYYAFAWQLGTGLDYEFENGWALGFGYRYFRTTASDEQDDPLFTLETKTETMEHSGLLTLTVPLGREVAKRFGGAPQESAKRTSDGGRLSWVPFMGDGKPNAYEAKPKSSEKPGVFSRAVSWIPFVGKDEPANPPAAPAALPPFPEAAKKAPAPRIAQRAPQGMTAATGEAPTAAIQLGAFTTKALAEAKWSTLTKASPALAAHRPAYETIKTPSEQILVRLRAGPMTKSEAKALCAAVTGQCMIIAR